MLRIDRLSLLAFALSAVAVAAPAEACSVSASGVAFGVYDPGDTSPDDGVGQVVVTCHPSEHGPTVAIGAGSSGNFSAREMGGGSDSLEYNLHTSVARTLVWGDGTGGSETVTLSGGTVSRGQRIFSRAIYGRIPARQSVSAGVYSDTIMVTVIF